MNLDNLSDDEWMIVHASVGQRCDLVVISQIKSALATTGMTVAERMFFLEALNTMATHEHLSAEVVARVEPACNTALRMLHEAMALGKERHHLIGGFEMFCVFLKLNPSLLAALKLCNRNFTRPPRSNVTERAA